MAQYRNDTTTGTNVSASRSVPTFSLDSGLVFERPASFFGTDYIQTLEPRAFATWTPFRDQSKLPNYDSGARDFNLSSMFAENAFSGNDRISDTRAVTLGVSSRLLSVSSGAEVVRVGVAQRALLKDQQVTLPGGAAVTERRPAGRDGQQALGGVLRVSVDIFERVQLAVGRRHQLDDADR